MGRLHDKMTQDLALKNLAPRTREEYLRCCRNLARYFMVSPDRLTLADVKDFLGQLLREGASPEKLKMHVAAVKFLYGVTLDREEMARKILWPKVPHRKPDILAVSEVERLLGAVAVISVTSTVISMVAYGAGLRISEVCRLRPDDIDSKRMLIHVRLGKGGKDRFVMLSERLLKVLRQYWVQTRPEGGWLFPGRLPKRPLTPSAVRKALREAAAKAKLRKRVTPHLLRHAFATHLHEAGTDLRVLQVLLGHSSIRSTVRYTQVSRQHIGTVKSPLDRIRTPDLDPRR